MTIRRVSLQETRFGHLLACEALGPVFFCSFAAQTSCPPRAFAHCDGICPVMKGTRRLCADSAALCIDGDHARPQRGMATA